VPWSGEQVDRLRQDALDEKQVEQLRAKDEKERHTKTQGELAQARADLAKTQV